jgi:serine/threonine-protein kinase
VSPTPEPSAALAVGAGARYEVIRRLAVGGMGEVFLARDRQLAGISRPVVIKRLLPDLAEDPAQVALFLDEARIASLLAHPNIVHVHEVGRDPFGYFIAMEYVPGPSLARLLERARREGVVMPRHVACHVVAELARALHHAHTARDADGAPLALVHRDVSPHNVLVSRAGDIKLADFGIARAAVRRQRTRTGVVRGKLAYMAPEQLERADADPRSDVFAAGIVLWEATLDRRLFDAERDVELIEQVRAAQVTAPHVIAPDYPEALASVVLTALAREPDERFASAAELELALRAAVPARGDERRLLGRMIERLFPELDDAAEPSPALGAAQTEELPRPPPAAATAPAARDQEAPTALARPVGRRRSSTRAVAIAAIAMGGLAGGWGLLRLLAGGGAAAPAAIATVDGGLADGAPAIDAALPAIDDAVAHADAAPRSPPRPSPSPRSLAVDAGPLAVDGAPAASARPDAAAAAAPLGKVAVSAEPWGRIEVDGVDYDKTDRQIELPAGRHTVRVIPSGGGATMEATAIIEGGKKTKCRAADGVLACQPPR